MIKIVVKGKGTKVDRKIKTRCKGTARLFAETVAIVAGACELAHDAYEKITPEMIMNAAKKVLEGKDAILKECKPDAAE